MQTEFNEIFSKIDIQYEAKKLPKLKTLLRGAANNISNLTNILLRKSLLKENLYNYSDEYSHEFYLPDEKDFHDKERPSVMFDRLKALMNALEYLANNMPANMDGIIDEYVRNTQKALSYIPFNNLNAAGAGINTKAIREMTNKLISGKDQILRRVIIDNLKLLEDNYTRMKSIVDDLVKYNKEKYKVKIRFKAFPFLKDEFTAKLLEDNPTDYLTKLARYMSGNIPDIPFNKQWIFEAIKSCYTMDAKSAYEKFSSEFVSSDRSNETSHAYIKSPRERLIDIIEYTAKSSSLLEKLYFILTQNLKFLQGRKKNFFEKFVDVFMKAVNPTSTDDFFHIEYVNPSDKTIQSDIVNVQEFMIAVKKKITIFNELTKHDSSVYKKIRMGKEEALYKFFENTYYDLILTKERIIGINGEIRLRVPKRNRVNLKEISEYIESLDEVLKKSGEMRRKYVIEQETTIGKGR